jgi:hypothetical protein
MHERSFSKGFHSLRKPRRAQAPGKQERVYDLFPHFLIESLLQEGPQVSRIVELPVRSRVEPKPVVAVLDLSEVTAGPSKEGIGTYSWP